MALTALTWKRLPTQTPVTGLVSDVLDAVYTALGSATYYDGAGRTPGSGSAWTVSRFQNVGLTEAVYATPPTGTLNQRIIFAGRTASGAGTMAAPDTSAAGVLQVSVNKNSGAFNDWTAANPFTSGQFFGYWRLVACAAVTVQKVNVYESAEAVIVACETATGTVYACILGAYLDPGTSDVADAEVDGRTYGVCTQGTVANVPNSFWTTGAFLSYSATANSYHAGIFTPGAGTIKPADLLSSMFNVVNTTCLLTPSGAPVLTPVLIGDDGGAGRCFGRIREVCMTRDGKLRELLQVGGVDTAHIVAGSSTVDQDCIALLA